MNFEQRTFLLLIFCFIICPASATQIDSLPQPFVTQSYLAKSEPFTGYLHTDIEGSPLGISSLPEPSTVLNYIKTQRPFNGYLRLNIENDMLILRQKTDRYFTSGMKLDYFFLKNPSERSMLSKIFPRLKKSDNFYGFTAVTNMYTPANMSEEGIIVGDRPYVGWAYLGLSNISNDPTTNTRFSTEYSLGAIGPIVQQKMIQSKWHKIIGRPAPKGWKNQIANDIALNLSFIGEKRVFKPSENLDIIGVLETNVVTVMNFMGVGGMVRVGWFNDYFRDLMPTKSQQNKWQAFVFVRPVVRVVADNSLLQGGLFNYDKSPYTIPRDDINHYYLNSEFGYSLSYRRFNVTYSQCVRTPEFRGAKNMFWGGTTFSLGF